MEGFKAKDISMQVQKKILSGMVTKNTAKVFIDETSANILDNLYRLIKLFTGSKKEAKKVVKDIIKIVVKLAVVYRHNHNLTEEDVALAKKLEERFNATAMVFISFYEVDYSYDRVFITKLLNDCQKALSDIVRRHLTEKSMGLVQRIFDFFKNPDFLDSVFQKNSQYQDLVAKIVSDMNIAMEKGEL